jgi:hypothetical protein
VRHRKEHDPDDQHEFPGGHRAARGKAAGSAGHLAVAGTRRPRSSIPRAAVEARCLGMGRTRARAHPESLRSPATAVSIRARSASAGWGWMRRCRAEGSASARCAYAIGRGGIPYARRA